MPDESGLLLRVGAAGLQPHPCVLKETPLLTTPCDAFSAADRGRRVPERLERGIDAGRPVNGVDGEAAEQQHEQRSPHARAILRRKTRAGTVKADLQGPPLRDERLLTSQTIV